MFRSLHPSPQSWAYTFTQQASVVQNMPGSVAENFLVLFKFGKPADVQTTIDKERSLNTIMLPPRERGWGHIDAERHRFKAISELRAIPEWSVAQYLRELYERSLPVESNMATSFTDRITDLVAQVPRSHCSWSFAAQPSM